MSNFKISQVSAIRSSAVKRETKDCYLGLSFSIKVDIQRKKESRALKTAYHSFFIYDNLF